MHSTALAAARAYITTLTHLGTLNGAPGAGALDFCILLQRCERHERRLGRLCARKALMEVYGRNHVMQSCDAITNVARMRLRSFGRPAVLQALWSTLEFRLAVLARILYLQSHKALRAAVGDPAVDPAEAWAAHDRIAAWHSARCLVLERTPAFGALVVLCGGILPAWRAVMQT